MWFWVCKISILSLLLIFLMHYLYSFFLQNLTTPKIKDLVNRPNEQYEDIINSIRSEKPIRKEARADTQNGENIKMKNELKNFLANEMNNKKQNPVFSSLGNNGGSGPGSIAGGGNLNFSSFS